MNFLIKYLVPFKIILSAAQLCGQESPFDIVGSIEERVSKNEAEIASLKSRLDGIEKESTRSTEEIYEIYDDNRYEVVEILLESPKLSLADAVDLFMERVGPKEKESERPDDKVTGEGREVVFFWATWCEPCQSAKRRLGDLMDHEDFKSLEFDSEYGKKVADLYRVTEIPTAIYLHNGVEFRRCSGDNVTQFIVGGWLNHTQPEKRRSTPIKVSTHSGPGHTHRCGSCGASWSHENWNVGNPSAHTCPSCGNLEWGNRTEGWSSSRRSTPTYRVTSPQVYWSSGPSYSNCPGGVCPTYR